MGCLNSGQGFSHWFGNIHLSGPCNRSCYFCIGQHMMELDGKNTLDAWPLPGIDAFLVECANRGVGSVFLTGTNTDPMLYRHHERLVQCIKASLPGALVGIRTNAALQDKDVLGSYDSISISVTSLDARIYARTMGSGKPPDIASILRRHPRADVKANIVLCPETVYSGDILRTLKGLAAAGIKRVNLREPYGQPHIGDPLADSGDIERVGTVYGMPEYSFRGMSVVYWDVHYVHVESVNLYATGRASVDYPITRGHSDSGEVLGQEKFTKSGRLRLQWVS